MSQPGYTQGYHDSVTRSHTARTAEKDAAFLLPHLKPHMKILDVGCGPGSITTGFCKYVPQGSVIGVDLSPEVINQARSLAAPKGIENLTFETGNVLEGLSHPAGSFDVIYCHQFLVHIADPVKALTEMKRVCKSSGGIVACREGDTPCRWYPRNEGLELWNEMLRRMVQAGGADTEGGGGRAMHAYARKAGFEAERVEKGASATVIATPEETEWWGDLHAERLEKSDVGSKYREVGATEEDIGKMVNALRDWGKAEDAWFAILQCEIVCKT
ncbi:hypothetical protein MMC09_001974 [Bachmanniomyces sp. S44760]|nr:hypothetical protein [Bachmanniomyces sp. S44760]